MAVPDALAVSGTFAGRYTIERELGRGATAHVYLARDQRHGTPVAIKLLRPDVSQMVGTERFLKEIRLSAGLHHPHILPVLDSGDHDGQLYFVLPHADGGTLRDRLLAEKQLPVDEALAITRTLAAALDHAHARGIIHRDVKPENILFTGGQACLADFGIARALDHGTGESTTSTGIVRGTPAYMSPEQASGESVLDGRTDLYSLACVTYEMLAGMRPFDGPTAQSVIAMRLNQPPRPVRAYRPSIASAVEPVFTRALAVAPADRFQSGEAFVSALHAASDTVDVAMPRRRLGRRALGTAGALAAATLAAVMYLMTVDPPGIEGIPDGDPRRIAILYLDDLTPETLPAYVADGVTEDLIDQLGEVRALQVISPYGVRPFRAGAISIDSIRRALKVGTVVTGSIAREGDSVRLNVRLVDAATSRQVATVPLTAGIGDMSALRTVLAERVAFRLRQRIGDRVALRENRATTRSAAAWDAAQVASSLLRRASETHTSIPYLEADSLFGQAARLDPAWGYPWVERGRIATTLALSRRQFPRSSDSATYVNLASGAQRRLWYALALSYADSALERDPRLAAALALRGETSYLLSLVAPDSADALLLRAERDLKASLALRPDAAQAWTALASVHQAQQRYATAAEAARRGYDADPYFESRRTLSTAFFTSLYAGEFANARRWCRTARDLYSTDPRFAECELTLLGWTGNTPAHVRTARDEVARIEGADSTASLINTWGYRRLMVALVAARAGMRDSTRALIASLTSGQVPDSVMGGTPLVESYAHLLVGDRDRSLALLESIVQDSPRTRRVLAAHPWFERLREDARFIALVQPR